MQGEFASLTLQLGISLSNKEREQHILSERSCCTATSHKSAQIWHSLDSWDSKLFGCRVGKVVDAEHSSQSDLSKCLDALIAADIYDYILFRIDSTDVSFLRSIEAHGGYYLDTSIDLCCVDPQKVTLTTTQPHIFSQEAESYSTQLKHCAEVFQFGRFFTDPHFSCGKVMYEKWIQNCTNGSAADRVDVLLNEEKVQGFVATNIKEVCGKKYVYIPLIAKHPDAISRSVGRALLTQAKVVAIESGCEAVVLGTHAANISALRAYTAAQFVPYHSSVTLAIYNATKHTSPD